jgi:tetratricopeptide (TPR) repeat protein
MEENLPAEQPETGLPCANCGQPALDGNYRTPLCQGCRDHFSRLAVPVWIKLFAGGIGLIMIFSLISFPKNITVGLHLQRGENAIEKGNYNTAEKELKKALETVPDNVEANGNLIIAAFNNQDYETMVSEVKKMQSVNIADKSLYSQISLTLEKGGRYVSSDSFDVFMRKHPEKVTLTDTAWGRYLQANPDDCYARMCYAAVLFDDKKYNLCDSILQQTLKIDEEYFNALAMETSVQREMGNYDASLGYAQRMLALNHESGYGLATEARTLLRQKKDKPALGLALRADSISPHEVFVLGSLALAWHFNGNTGERDAVLKRARSEAKDSTDNESLRYVQDVLDKKEKFRD